MKRLESIKLIQFLLYESEEFRVGETSGIFGPNGSGKSSALDAVQIAMFGANKNLMAFNAQADSSGVKQTRTLRSYCLGQYGDDIVESVRPNATTYITLTWRNLETGEPTTAGICIEASLDSEDARVLGRYVINGVELAMADHLQAIDDGTAPLPWNSFRSRLMERAKISGENPLFEDPSSFTKQILFALRGKNGQPSYDAFIRAFRFALRMKFDKSVDQIVRSDVLESRPTNVKKFKAIVDTFKHLNQLIETVEKKILDGKQVADLYRKAQLRLRQAASWRGLAAIATEEEAQLACEARHEQWQAAKQTARQLRTTCDRLEQSQNTTEAELRHLTTRQQLHTAHQENADAQLNQENAQTQLSNSAKALQGELRKVCSALTDAAQLPYLVDHRELLLSLAAGIRPLVASPELAVTEVLQQSLQEMAAAGSEIRSTLHAALLTQQNQANEAREQMRTIADALERARQGKAPLSLGAQTLLRELLDDGLNPIPVCDLVKVKDPRWQPAIEAYLGKNIEALLLPQEQEQRAFEIYRELKGRRAIYGVKIVRSNQVKMPSMHQSGLVAELIEGTNPVAVAYLRSQLGNLKRVDETNEALKGERTLTMDGMYVSPRDFERLRLDEQNLRIGSGTQGQAERLRAELGQAALILRQSEDRIMVINQALGSSEDFASSMVSRLILSLTTTHAEAVRQCELADQRVANITDAEYLAICDGIHSHQVTLARLKSDAKQALEAAVKSESGLQALEAAYGSSTLRLEQCIQFKEQCRQHPDYDTTFVASAWDKLLERFDEPGSMATHCKEECASAESVGQKQAGLAHNKLWIYLQDHHEVVPEGALDDWRVAKAWIDQHVQKLEDTELPEHKAHAEAAYRASQETFRRDVAIALNSNLEFLRQTFDRLNAALHSTPPFTNGERYQFMYKVRPHLKPLLDFIKQVADFGVDGGLFGEAGHIPPQFEELLRDKAAVGNAGGKSPLDDYREFYEFDVRIEQVVADGATSKTIGHLSKRIGPGSGGEHRAPLYVIAGAGLWSAYRMDHGANDGLRLIMLDEAFDKMDTSNIVATMKYLQELGLQVLLACPGENLGILNAFLDSYFEIQKDPVRHAVQIDRVEVTEAMREQFREDLWEFHPELVEKEIASMRARAAPVPARISGATQ